MAATSFTRSLITTAYPKYNDFLVGNIGFNTAYEFIETQTVGAGGAASVAFNSIPTTYKHLQIRALVRLGTDGQGLRLTTNSGTLVRRHYLYGDGGPNAAAGADTNNGPFYQTYASQLASTFGAAVIDILDYTSTTKNSTIRSLTGYDLNTTAGSVGLFSQLYTSSAAITSITLTASSGNINQHSTFSLYGVK